jgi:hypothetical protein
MSLRCVARATVGMSQKNVAAKVNTSAVGVNQNQYVTAVCDVRTVGVNQYVTAVCDVRTVGVNQYVTAVCDVRTVGVSKNVTAKWSPDCIARDECESLDEFEQAACHTTTLSHHEMS